MRLKKWINFFHISLENLFFQLLNDSESGSNNRLGYSIIEKKLYSKISFCICFCQIFTFEAPIRNDFHLYSKNVHTENQYQNCPIRIHYVNSLILIAASHSTDGCEIIKFDHSGFVSRNITKCITFPHSNVEKE